MVDLSTGETGASALRRRYKRKPFKPIDREQFREIRLMHRYSIDEVAKVLQVTPRTVRHWESGITRIPYAAFKLLRILVAHELPSSVWRGWRVIGDTLYSPVGRGFKVHELTYLANYLTMARYWQADYARRSAERKTTRADIPAYAGLRLISSRGES
jgi:DNA-binding transcriptional regulator YiaG